MVCNGSARSQSIAVDESASVTVPTLRTPRGVDSLAIQAAWDLKIDQALAQVPRSYDGVLGVRAEALAEAECEMFSELCVHKGD